MTEYVIGNGLKTGPRHCECERSNPTEKKVWIAGTSPEMTKRVVIKQDHHHRRSGDQAGSDAAPEIFTGLFTTPVTSAYQRVEPPPPSWKYIT